MSALHSLIHFLIPFEIFKYDNPLSPTNSAILPSVIQDVVDRQNISPLYRAPPLWIFLELLEEYNITFSEMWIENIDVNFRAYHGANRPPLNIPTSPPPINYYYRPDKSFSGNVSGMIAESIFIYFLGELGIEIDQIGHLRPVKQSAGFVPDFIILDNRRALDIVISGDYLPRICAEVKGTIGNLNKKQLTKALSQLNYVIPGLTDCGIIFYAFRNRNNRNLFEGIIFEVR